MSASYQGLLALLRELVASADLSSLLTAVLEGALRLIPGAQAGSALVREGEAYRFVAMRGHNIPLPSYPLSLEDELRWYGGSLQQALQAQPIISRVQAERSGLSAEDRQTLHPIYWTLSLPIPLAHRVEAWLCLDRLEPTPYPPEALPLAQELGKSLGVVLLALKERENTQARLEREERLARVLAVLSTFHRADLLWQALPHLILEMVGRQRAVALRRVEDGLEVCAAVNWDESLGQRVPPGKGLSWLALEERRVQIVPLEHPQLYRPREGRGRFAAFVPILDAHNQPAGVVVAYGDTPFDPEDGAVLESFGRGVGQALARLEAQAAQARELARLQALAQLSQRLTEAQSTGELLQHVVREALAQTGASSSLVSLYRPQEDVLEVVAAAGYAAERAAGTRHPRGQGLAWRVLEKRSPLYLPDASAEPSARFLSGQRSKAAYLGVPLGDPEGRIVGVLSVDTAGTGGVLRPQDRYALEALARVAGVLLSRLQALEQAYRQANNYQALVQMSSDLELLDDPQPMAQRALVALLGLSGLHAGGVYRFQPAMEDPQRGQAQLQVWHGRPELNTLDELVQHFRTLPVYLEREDSLLGRALKTGQTQFLPDYQAWEMGFGALKEQGLRTLVVTPLRVRNQPYGALVLVSLQQEVGLSQENLALVEAVARRLERAWERGLHLEEIARTREDALRALGLGLELRDLETKGHTDRVVLLTEALGRRVGFADLEGLRLGAYLHDLGKLAIPDAILLKPGTLTDAEWRIIQSHCDIGFGMLENLGFLSQTARNIVRYHHERIDGSGYPFGLRQEEIPLEARLFAVVDVYDALLHSRPYKAAWSQEEALRELRRQAGRTLDAGLVEAFVALIERVPSQEGTD
ncbi:GAF domain-containing protein [Meiothermus rufus]|uniref:GAF domain-containing protein n=1 Tax=Meiothermus rufus TaxID=604332 RepID=UPI00041D31BE|nr:GAF domain-containing protein [Meiothermus rufus]